MSETATAFTQIERFQRLVASCPDHELYRFSLGKALMDAGEFGEARMHLEKALEKRSDWMVVTILLARCLLALGEKSGAAVLLERARQLAIEQNHEEPQQEIQHLLDTIR